MNKALVALAVIGALIGSGAAYSSATSGGPSDDPFVVGGGRFGPGCFDVQTSFCFANPRDLSIDAHLEKQGTKVSGVGQYGNNDSTFGIRFDVTCVSVSGNGAAVGGVVRSSSDPTFVGYGALIFLRDNGPPGQATRDRSSPLFLDALASTDWPAGFPYTCPAPDSTFNTIGFLPVHSGDIVVSPGSD